uniref:Lrrc40 protein n=1 Tax=Fopius arisanus TaxID=64838 RepID=A0A0C9PYY9_9HYME
MQSEIKKPSRSLVSAGSSELHSSGHRGPLGSTPIGSSRISPKRKHREIENSSVPHENGIFNGISLRKASKPSAVQSPPSKRLKREHKNLQNSPDNSMAVKPRRTVKQLKYERMKSRIVPSDIHNAEKKN